MSGEDLCGYVELRFYDSDGTTRRDAVLPEAHGIMFTDELAGDGGASYSASLLAQALAVDPDLLEDGICKAAMVLAAGEAPTEVFAWELVPTSGTCVGEVEEKQVQCTAPGVRNLLSRMTTAPERGAINRYTADARVFGWMSERFAPWYDPADWSTPVFVETVYPGWPAPTTSFITAEATAAVGEKHLFRGELTVSTDQTVRVIYYGDDRTWFYVNGELLSQNEPTGHSVSFDVFLQAGLVNVFAAQVENVYKSELKFACNVCAITSANQPGTVLLKTDLTHWKAHKVVGAKPGWTPGAWLKKLIEEGQGEGSNPAVEGSGFLTMDFDEDVDSAGVTWPKRMQDRAFGVGQPVSEGLRELEETYCDVHIKPDGTVQAFVNQGTDRSATIWLQPGVNLLRMTYQGQPIRGTRLLMRTDEGWLSKIDTAGTAAYGLRFATVTSGLNVSLAQGQHLADETVPRMARPNYVYTATFRATTGCVPWRNFFKGDWIKAPDRKGVMVTMRVLSLSASTPDDTPGPVTFTAELEIP